VTGSGKGYKPERSFAMITALILVSLLMVAVWEFSYEVTQNLRLAGNLVKEVQALAIARAAYRGGLAVLKADDDSEDGRFDQWRAMMPPMLPIGKGTAELYIDAEDGRINLNHLVNDFDNYESVNSTIFSYAQGVFELLKYDPNIVYGIVDFIDRNSLASSSGAEEGYYLSLQPPILIKNGPLDSLAELLLVKDITLEMYYGKVLKKEAKEKIKEPEKKFEIADGLVHYFTVYGDYAKSSTGAAKNYGSLNINFIPIGMLRALADDVTDLTLEKIEETRAKSNITEKEITNKEYMMTYYGFSSATYDYFFPAAEVRRLDVKSKVFRIVGKGVMDTIEKKVIAVVKRENKKFKVLRYTEQ